MENKKSINLFEEIKEKGFVYIAVYGTLKNGFGNYEWCLKGKSKFTGFGITFKKGLLFDVGFPYFVPEKYVKDRELKKLITPIQVEVYRIEDINVIKDLDRLEGYPDHYDRKKLKIQILQPVIDNQSNKIIVCKGQVINAWIYYIKYIPYYAKLLNGNPDYTTTLNVCKDCSKIEKCKSGGNIERIKYTYWGDDTLLSFLELLGNRQ